MNNSDQWQDSTNEENNLKKEENESRGAAQPGGEENLPQWCRVSYRSEEGFRPIAEGTRKSERRNHKKAVVIAACLAFFLIFSSVACLGGYFLGRIKNSDVTPDGSSSVNSGSTAQIDNGRVFSSTGADKYNYADVVLNKNDGSTLADSENGSAGGAAMSRIKAVAAVRDSVVEITTTTTSYRGKITAGAGSGVIIHADGIIVTNNHVVSGAEEIYVRLTNGNTYKAYLRGVDDENDIALIKIMPEETLTVAKLGYSGALAVGEEVFAIGNPLGELGGTVTYGGISALSREVTVEEQTMTLLQTDAAINAGNSGGGLFNMAGELIGVVNAKVSASGVEGLGFAIPIDTAVVSVDSLLKYGYIRGRAALGATVTEKKALSSYYGYIDALYVTTGTSDGTLKEGDWILAVGGTEVSSVNELNRVIRSHKIGETVSVVISRNRKQVTVSVTLVEEVPAQVDVSFGE